MSGQDFIQVARIAEWSNVSHCYMNYTKFQIRWRSFQDNKQVRIKRYSRLRSEGASQQQFLYFFAFSGRQNSSYSENLLENVSNSRLICLMFVSKQKFTSYKNRKNFRKIFNTNPIPIWRNACQIFQLTDKASSEKLFFYIGDNPLKTSFCQHQFKRGCQFFPSYFSCRINYTNQKRLKIFRYEFHNLNI